MLKRFAVENFRGLKDRAVLDFTRTKKYGFNAELIRDGLINKALIVGKNGCGKTNLGLALFDIVMTLTDLDTDRRQRDASAYLNGDSDRTSASFEYEFALDEDDVVYSYRKISPDTIVYERMEVNGETVFVRDGGGIKLCRMDLVGAEGLKVNPANGRLPVLRFIVNNTDQQPDSVLSRLMAFVSGMLYFRSVQDGNPYSGLVNGSEDLARYIIEHDQVEEFQRFLQDVGGIGIRLGVVSVGGMPDVLVQETAGRRYPLEDVLSSGTGALMLFFYWMKHFDAVTFLYMDEFDAYYHYALSESVLRLVCGMHGFQTVFTSHNVALVSNRVMRPDCCWMMSDGIVRAFPDLTGRELREGHNMEKLLRGGEFDVRPPHTADHGGQAGRAQVPQEDDGADGRREGWTRLRVQLRDEHPSPDEAGSGGRGRVRALRHSPDSPRGRPFERTAVPARRVHGRVPRVRHGPAGFGLRRRKAAEESVPSLHGFRRPGEAVHQLPHAGVVQARPQPR